MSVYFARVGRYIKVGYSNSPERRVANLFKSQTFYSRPADVATSDPRSLLLVIPGGVGREAECHAALDDYAVGGEFFVDEPGVHAFMARAARGDIHPEPRPEGSVIDWTEPHPLDHLAAQAVSDVFKRGAA